MRCHQSFAEGIRCRGAHRRNEGVELHRRSCAVARGRVDGVAVANGEAVRFIAGDDGPELLNRPLGGRVFGLVDDELREGTTGVPLTERNHLEGMLAPRSAQTRRLVVNRRGQWITARVRWSERLKPAGRYPVRAQEESTG